MNLVYRGVATSVTFYREARIWRTAAGAPHTVAAAADGAGGLALELDSPRSRERGTTAGKVVPA